jgi:hypothetical protein
MTFSVEFQGYIGVGTLAPWPTARGGLLPPWAAALGSNATALGCAKSGPRYGPLLPAPNAEGHDV